MEICKTCLNNGKKIIVCDFYRRRNTGCHEFSDDKAVKLKEFTKKNQLNIFGG
jgi:hypothetical protein